MSSGFFKLHGPNRGLSNRTQMLATKLLASTTRCTTSQEVVKSQFPVTAQFPERFIQLAPAERGLCLLHLHGVAPPEDQWDQVCRNPPLQ